MKRLLILVLIGLVAASTATGSSPHLRITTLSPLTVRGTGFAASERVRVTVRSDVSTTGRVLTGSNGGFTARFPMLTFNYCTASVIRAFGATGDRATLFIRNPPECPAPLTP